MRRQGKLHLTRDILSSFQLFPVDYFCKRYCIFQEDAIMTQQTTPRIKSVVAMTTACVILAILSCNLPQADSLGSECYTITGLDYRGSQDKIEVPPGASDLITSTACLPWNSSVESTKPRARERGIGNHNSCRNPDGDILPWCKVAGIPGADGAWGYCHLPTCQVPGYLGCFPDHGSPSALDGIDVLHKAMTVGSCIDFCRRNGYKYAGLEAGHACYCGNSGYDRYGTSAERGTHCAHKCFGNKEQPCGGDGYVDVYRADIGSSGTRTPMRTPTGAVYSPGFPDYPASPGMMTSLGATEIMMQKHKDKKNEDRDEESETEEEIEPPRKEPTETCEWKVNVKKASDVQLLIRKIDPKGKLGGTFEIEANDDAMIVVTTSSKEITSRIVWITESPDSRHDVDVVVPDENRENGNNGAKNIAHQETPKWSAELAKSKWPRYTLPSNSMKSMVSIKGGAFTVRLLRSSDLMAALKSTYEFQRQRSRSRKRSSGAEWSRFVIEYEATFPEGVTYEPEDDVIVDVSTDRKNGGSNNRRSKDHKKMKHGKNSHGGGQESRRTISSFGRTKFTISQEDALAIKEAVSASAGGGSDSVRGEGSNSPIKIEVFVEPVPGDASTADRNTENKKGMSEFTIPLLLAVLLTTTAVLILFAVLVISRRGGITGKKNEKSSHDYSRGLVVRFPGDGDTEKTGSNSNLSSTPSTADSVLLTDSENSKYSPRLARNSPPPVNPTAIKDYLMEVLKSHPGLIPTHPPMDADQYKQNQHYFAMGDSRHDDVTALPGPCPHCCGCADDNRSHRHGDSCRAHHNQGKYGRPQMGTTARSGGGKNPRGLSIRPNKIGSGAQPSLAPPLSPISEGSSVTSSMLSLPITSANSQTSLLKQASKTSPHKSQKRDSGPESEAFLASESDAESGISDETRISNSEFALSPKLSASKLRLSEKIGGKLQLGRYLGGAAAACYDSGYATSNYEEEEAGSDVISKDNKNFPSIRSECEQNDLISP